jgi:hypothetical protein
VFYGLSSRGGAVSMRLKVSAGFVIRELGWSRVNERFSDRRCESYPAAVLRMDDQL